MLLLRLQTPKGRYVMDTSIITEVIPLVHYSKIPHGPDFLAGVISFRGQPVPVVDLGFLLDETPCRERMNTRIVLIKVDLPKKKQLLFGIIAEGISGTMRFDRGAGESSEVLLQEEVNSLEMDGQQFLQLLNVEKVLGPDKIERLAAYC